MGRHLRKSETCRLCPRPRRAARRRSGGLHRRRFHSLSLKAARAWLRAQRGARRHRCRRNHERNFMIRKDGTVSLSSSPCRIRHPISFLFPFSAASLWGWAIPDTPLARRSGYTFTAAWDAWIRHSMYVCVCICTVPACVCGRRRRVSRREHNRRDGVYVDAYE